MNLTLANPALLPLLALIAAPLLVHLFARSHPKQFPFSSTRFIAEIKKRTARLQRPRSWLLLLLRTLLFLALIAMILRPVLVSSDPLASPGQSKSVVILVDQSASMAAQDGARTRFGSAVARASEILSGLGGNDVANLILVKRTVAAALPAPSSNRGALQEILKKASVSMEAPDWRSALGEAQNQLKKAAAGGAAGEIHIISDFQESNWSGVEVGPMENARLVMIQAARERPGNQAVSRLEVTPRNLLSGEEAEAVCEIANYSDEPVLRTVFLRVGETVDSREVRLPANARGGASFLFKLTKPGEQIVEVSLDSDAFPYDNTSRALVNVQEKVGVAISGSDRDTADAIMKGLRSVEWFQTTDSPGDLTSVWILAGWDGKRDRDKVDRFLKQGGGIIVMPEAGNNPADFPLPSILGSDLLRRQKLDTPAGLRINQQEHPLFRAFAGGQFGDPAGGRLVERLQLPVNNDEHVLISYNDGMPALALWHSPASLALWNIPLGAANLSWTQRAEFVPLLAEFVLAMRNASAIGVSEAVAGETLFRKMERDVLDEEVELAMETERLPLQRIENRLFGSAEALAPGIYQWKVQGSPVGYGVVNFPNVESDLRKNLPASAISGEATQLQGDEEVSRLREGQPLWPYLLLVALLLVLAEGAMVWRGRATA